jgi:hypothetical protein
MALLSHQQRLQRETFFSPNCFIIEYLPDGSTSIVNFRCKFGAFSLSLPRNSFCGETQCFSHYCRPGALL